MTVLSQMTKAQILTWLLILLSITDFRLYIFDELKSNLIVFHQSKTAFYKKGETMFSDLVP